MTIESLCLLHDEEALKFRRKKIRYTKQNIKHERVLREKYLDESIPLFEEVSIKKNMSAKEVPMFDSGVELFLGLCSADLPPEQLYRQRNNMEAMHLTGYIRIFGLCQSWYHRE